MNRLVTDTLAAAVRAAEASARARERPPPRVLFLHGMILGNAAYASELQRAAASRDDFDAFHVELAPGPWMSLAGARLPGPAQWDAQRLRHMAMWRARLGARLADALRRGVFDAVHALTRDVAAALPAGAPAIVNTDATAALEAREHAHAAIPSRVLASWERAIFRRAPVVACWSRWAAASVVGDLGVHDQRVLVAPPALDPARVPARRQRPDGPVRIAFVGHDWRRKRGGDLLRWHQQRWADRAELHLFSAGAPALTDARAVVRHGTVERETLLRDHLPSMDLLVLPSAEETFGWAILEAAAAGLPVVASRLAAIPEQVADGRTGLLVAPCDEPGFVGAIDRLVGSPALRRSMGRAARERVTAEFARHGGYTPLLDRLAALARTASINEPAQAQAALV